MSGQRATLRHRRLSLRYGLVILLFLLPSCNEAQTESTNVTEDSDYAISLEPQQSQYINEGNQNSTFTCRARGQLGWTVTNSNGDSVADYEERGIAIVNDGTSTNEETLSYLSILATRQNDGLWVNCFISTDTSIRSVRVQLNVIFVESTDPPNSTVATGIVYSTTTGEEETLATTESDDDDNKRRRHVIGIVVGCVVVVVLLIIFGAVLRWYYPRIGCVHNRGQQPNVDLPSTMGANSNSNSRPKSLSIGVAKSESKVSEEKSNALTEPQNHHLVVTPGGGSHTKRSERPHHLSRQLNIDSQSVLPQDLEPNVALQSFHNGFGSQKMAETKSNNVHVGISSASFAQETEDVAVTCFAVSTPTGVLFRETLGAAKSPDTVHHVLPEESVSIPIDVIDST